jgi:hypothetical protein
MGDKVEAVASTVRAALEGFAHLAGSAFEHANGKLDHVDARIEAIDSELDKADTEIRAVGGQVDGFGARLGATSANIDAVGVKVDAVAAKLDNTGAQVDAVRAQVDGVGVKLDHAGSVLRSLGAKLDQAEARRARDKRDVIRAVIGSGGLVGLGLIALALVQSGLLPATQPGDGGGPYGLRTLTQTEADLGRSKVRLVPQRALPHQAVAPCRVGETTLHGSCWIKVADQSAPCPPDFYQEGNFCYVPMMAEPKTPSSESPVPANPGRR